MTCPHLAFRDAADGRSFDRERPFCAVTGSFVQPMRADICSERYDLEPAAHCEIYREHEGLDGARDGVDTADRGSPEG